MSASLFKGPKILCCAWCPFTGRATLPASCLHRGQRHSCQSVACTTRVSLARPLTNCGPTIQALPQLLDAHGTLPGFPQLRLFSQDSSVFLAMLDVAMPGQMKQEGQRCQASISKEAPGKKPESLVAPLVPCPSLTPASKSPVFNSNH